MFSVPLPHSTTCAPSLHLSTALSASALAFSLSLLLATVSARVFWVPLCTAMVTPVDLPHTMGAVVVLVSCSPFSISVTSSVPAFTVMLPSAQPPDTT